MITAKIESMEKIPELCAECPFQSMSSNCKMLKAEHQSCPVTFYPELVEGATEKQADGTTVIDVFKTGRRCLCPLEVEK